MSELKGKRMTNAEREMAIAAFIRTGKSPEGYEVKEDGSTGTFRVRCLKQLSEREKLVQAAQRTKERLDKLNRTISEMKPEPEAEEVEEPSSENLEAPLEEIPEEPEQEEEQPKLNLKRKTLKLK
jgi:hypothetical protein